MYVNTSPLKQAQWLKGIAINHTITNCSLKYHQKLLEIKSFVLSATVVTTNF